MMKNNTLLLTKVLLKSGEGFGFKLKTKWAWVLFLVSILVLVPSLIFTYLTVISNIYEILETLDQHGLLISLGLAICSFIVFFSGLFHIISSFYFASDIEDFLPLPVRPKQIVGAKFVVAILYQYLLLAFLFLPILIYYGVQQGVGVVYYFYGLIILLLIPVVPLALATLLVMVIMRFANLSRYKELLKILGGITAILLGISVSYLVQYYSADVNPDQVMALIEIGNNSLALLMAKILPTINWATQVLFSYQTLGGLVNLLIYMSVSIGVYIVLLHFSDLVYFKGVIGISETGSRRPGSINLSKLVKRRSVIFSYTLNELKLLFRTPIYFLNCVLINLIWPVFFVVPFILGSSETPEGANMELMTELINDPSLKGIVIAVIIAALTFIGGSNGIAATAISREGQTLFTKRYIPVSYRDQLLAKILPSFIIGYGGLVFLIGVLVLAVKIPNYIAIISLLLGWLPILFTSFIGILVDVHNPKLEWDSEQKAVKQNLNVLYSILASMLISVVVVVVPIWLGLNLIWTILFLTALFGGANFLLYRAVCTVGVTRFAQLEG